MCYLRSKNYRQQLTGQSVFNFARLLFGLMVQKKLPEYRAESENFHYFSAISKNLRPFLSNLHIWQISDLLAVKMLVISQPILLRWLTTVFPRLSSARYDSLPHVNICRACKNHAKKLPGNQPPTKGPRRSSNPPRFYLTSKVCPNSFALPTTTRRTRCFQVGNYTKITPSTAERPCRPD